MAINTFFKNNILTIKVSYSKIIHNKSQCQWKLYNLKNESWVLDQKCINFGDKGCLNKISLCALFTIKNVKNTIYRIDINVVNYAKINSFYIYLKNSSIFLNLKI